jgi:hypothetical protein
MEEAAEVEATLGEKGGGEGNAPLGGGRGGEIAFPGLLREKLMLRLRCSLSIGGRNLGSAGELRPLARPIVRGKGGAAMPAGRGDLGASDKKGAKRLAKRSK